MNYYSCCNHDTTSFPDKERRRKSSTHYIVSPGDVLLVRYDREKKTLIFGFKGTDSMQNWLDNIRSDWVSVRRSEKNLVSYRTHLRDQHLLGPDDERVVYADKPKEAATQTGEGANEQFTRPPNHKKWGLVRSRFVKNEKGEHLALNHDTPQEESSAGRADAEEDPSQLEEYDLHPRYTRVLEDEKTKIPDEVLRQKIFPLIVTLQSSHYTGTVETGVADAKVNEDGKFVSAANATNATKHNYRPRGDLVDDGLLRIDLASDEDDEAAAKHPVTSHNLLLHRGFLNKLPCMLDLGIRYAFEEHGVSICDPEHVKQIIFTGHSRGGGMASQALLLFLLQYQNLIKEAAVLDGQKPVPISVQENKHVDAAGKQKQGRQWY